MLTVAGGIIDGAVGEGQRQTEETQRSGRRTSYSKEISQKRIL
jgi:hypothetical protein